MTAVLAAKPAGQNAGDGANFTVSIGSFTASVDAEGHVSLDGELGVDGLEVLRAVLDQALVEGRDIVVDAGGLSLIAKPALTELLCFQLFAAVEDRELRLVRMSRPVAEVIDQLDLRPFLTSPDVEEPEPSASQA